MWNDIINYNKIDFYKFKKIKNFNLIFKLFK